DFNLYNANEPAYQQFINYSNNFYAFYDPVAGSWNQMHHTQSTHTSATSGSCFSTGGMDDRFDFILVSPYIYYGNNRVKAIIDSYRAVGQDGNRYNQTINNPSNSAVPDYIANALYNLSDHIPVTMLFDISAPLALATATQNWSINVVNPVREQLDMQLSTPTSGYYIFDIYTVDGRPIAHFEQMCTAGNNRINRPLNVPAGFYLLKISNPEGRNGNVQSQKIVKY
ncbi:MAG: T9SS type A sorting domain-containing protein, partial [Bacteroidales bacterium]|nr:T9SS type A sorting domain-containing protein [Bacteroidales bacterium]